MGPQPRTELAKDMDDIGPSLEGKLVPPGYFTIKTETIDIDLADRGRPEFFGEDDEGPAIQQPEAFIWRATTDRTAFLEDKLTEEGSAIVAVHEPLSDDQHPKIMITHRASAIRHQPNLLRDYRGETRASGASRCQPPVHWLRSAQGHGKALRNTR
ncbi:hypothetical protein AcidC75_10790 [Acidisoma sp. C75]